MSPRTVLILSLMIFDAASIRADIQDALDASSTRADIQVHERKQNATSVAASWSPWELTYESLSCAALQPQPWHGLHDHWPDCWARARKAGKDLSTEGNCNLCDVKLKASKPEAKAGMTGTGCTPTVTCAAVRLGSTVLGKASKACSEGHGVLSAVNGLNDNAANRGKYGDSSCLPCPAGCKSCNAVVSKVGMIPGVTPFSYRKFKCILSAVGTPATGGETCVKPEGFECDDCKKRTCGGLLPGFVKGCSTNDYKTTCHFSETYDNTVETPATASDYTLTLKAGEDKAALPTVLEYLTGGNRSGNPFLA